MDRELVVSRGDRSISLEMVDPAFDRVTLAVLNRVDGQVQLGGEPAARAFQAVISRLGEYTAWRFLLQVALPAGLCRMLMGAAHGGVDVQVPRNRTAASARV
ncbi:hypothetical protein [Streptomyces sp. MMBL 11-3]|uniref:hypothetical protein n=1 Tax=Streptomyces sp. MMBL 11-3 TaxID=3382639 RepID=UPI0039B555F5